MVNFVTVILTMSTTTINVAEAKAHFSEYLANLKPGDRIIVCKRNKPTAQVLPIEEPSPRHGVIFDLGRGEFEFDEKICDEPLPEEIMRGFRGEDPDDPLLQA